MRNFKLKVNDRVEVINDEKTYKALIMDLQEDFLQINVPVCDGEYLMLHSKEKIELNSYLENGGCYNFNAEVISRGMEENIVYYRLSKPFNIRKIQRRNFFRVQLIEDIEYKKITNIQEEEFDNLPYKNAIMVDLSAGGLRFKVRDEITKDDLLLVKVKLSEIELLLQCDIVRIEDTLDKEKLCGLRFTDISGAQSELIVKELFKIMRKQRANL